jgi:hypothetical protein
LVSPPDVWSAVPCMTCAREPMADFLPPSIYSTHSLNSG